MTGRVPRDGPHSEQLYSGSLAEHEKEAGRAAQAARGMTQEQVAIRMGVSVPSTRSKAATSPPRTRWTASSSRFPEPQAYRRLRRRAAQDRV